MRLDTRRCLLTVGLALLAAGPVAADDEWRERTALERHVSFFDRDGDGRITVRECRRGLEAIGMGRTTSALFALGLNAVLATRIEGEPSLTIDVGSIDRAIHGSHTGVYDAEGRFDPAAFRRLFVRWDLDGDGALDAGEIARRTIDDAEPFDLYGIAASSGEFALLFVLAAEDGRISRERMEAMYDGSLFHRLAGEEPPWTGAPLPARPDAD